MPPHHLRVQKACPCSTKNPLFLFQGEGIQLTASGLDKTWQHCSSNCSLLVPSLLFFPSVLAVTARAGSDPDALLWNCHLFLVLSGLANMMRGYTCIHHRTKIHVLRIVGCVVSDKWLLTGPIAAHTPCEMCEYVGYPALRTWKDLSSCQMQKLAIRIFFDCLSFPGANGQAFCYYTLYCLLCYEKRIRGKTFFHFCFWQGVHSCVLSLLLLTTTIFQSPLATDRSITCIRVNMHLYTNRYIYREKDHHRYVGIHNYDS